jgi:uncharacterized protein with PIN domain
VSKMLQYTSLDAEEVLEEAERESQEFLDALASSVQQLLSAPDGAAQLLSLCARQVDTSRRALRVFEVELRGADLLPDEEDQAKAAFAQHQTRLNQLVGGHSLRLNAISRLSPVTPLPRTVTHRRVRAQRTAARRACAAGVF